MLRLILFVSVLFGFHASYAASKNCPLTEQTVLSKACLHEVVEALLTEKQTSAIRKSVETNLRLEGCQPVSEQQLRWDYFADDGEVGPYLKVTHIFECNPDSGYDGYKVTGRYYLNYPHNTTLGFSFLGTAVAPID